MANIFNLGDVGSKAVWTTALQSLIDQGQIALDGIESFRINQLVEFNNRLMSINARRSRAKKIKGPNIAAIFHVADLTNIDESNTTATIRVDSETATLKERSIPSNLTPVQTDFSSTQGAITTIDPLQNQYTIISSSIPVGVYDILLNSSFNINVLVFDILASSNATVTVSLSVDGLTYTPAYQVTISGYRVTAWFQGVPGNRVRISITPPAPDSLGGNQYTFGLSGLAARSTEFNLRSEVVSQPNVFTPVSQNVSLNAVVDPNLIYYLRLTTSLTPGTFVQIAPNTSIRVPNVVSQYVPTVAPTTITGFITTLAANYIQSTLLVTEITGGANTPMVIVKGLDYGSGSTNLRGEYIGLVGSTLKLVNGTGTINTSRRFSITYLTAIPVTATLKVRLSTSDKAITPFYRGAILEEI